MMNRRSILFAFVGAIALFLILFGIGGYYFGGFGQFLAFVNSKPLYISPRQIDLGSHEVGTETVAVFMMTNLSSKEISIVGERSSCNCAFSEGFPISILPGKTADLKVNVRLPKYDSSYDQTIIFMVAEPNKLGMHPVRITATIPNPLPRPVEEPEPEIPAEEPTEDQTSQE
jgi:hypothetical protein